MEFFFTLVIKLFNNTGINKYVIKLVEDKWLLYSLIYILNLVELETLRAYIKTHLKIVFIRLSKFFIDTFIFFYKKLNSSVRLSIKY